MSKSRPNPIMEKFQEYGKAYPRIAFNKVATDVGEKGRKVVLFYPHRTGQDDDRPVDATSSRGPGHIAKLKLCEVTAVADLVGRVANDFPGYEVFFDGSESGMLFYHFRPQK